MTIQWTVRRLGPHPANQIAREHMLGLVEAPDVEAAERAILEAPGVTLYPGRHCFSNAFMRTARHRGGWNVR